MTPIHTSPFSSVPTPLSDVAVAVVVPVAVAVVLAPRLSARGKPRARARARARCVTRDNIRPCRRRKNGAGRLRCGSRARGYSRSRSRTRCCSLVLNVHHGPHPSRCIVGGFLKVIQAGRDIISLCPHGVRRHAGGTEDRGKHAHFLRVAGIAEDEDGSNCYLLQDQPHFSSYPSIAYTSETSQDHPETICINPK